MPELPEVETIRLSFLRDGPHGKPLPGRIITHAQVLWERTLEEPDVDTFTRRIQGQAIQGIERRGKFLIFRLSQDVLLVHLRMSGDLIVEPDSAPMAKHHRLLLEFQDGQRLAFNDTRKFGRVWLVDDPERVVGSLGPEPLDPAFTAGDLYRGLQNHRRQLKPLLMDQSFLAGLGNIYTDEALHGSRLHPLLLSNEVTQDETVNLHDAIRNTLLKGIQQNGASIDWVYRGGGFQEYFKVYGRTGQLCFECGTPIERILVGQRATHFCPNCQRL